MILASGDFWGGTTDAVSPCKTADYAFGSNPPYALIDGGRLCQLFGGLCPHRRPRPRYVGFRCALRRGGDVETSGESRGGRTDAIFRSETADYAFGSNPPYDWTDRLCDLPDGQHK